MPTSDAFETLYKKLNKAQKEAVDTIDGPVMVVAGPGTGKTTILTLRMANILKKTDTPPHGILAITYTDAGVKAMRQKLVDIIGNRAHEVYIHTFHSFASAIIAEYPDHFLHLDGLSHMSEVEAESLIRAIIEDPDFAEIRPMGKPDAYLSAIIRTIDAAKREALTPENIKRYAEEEIVRIKNDEDSISSRGASKGKLKADAEDRIGKCERTIIFSEVFRQYEEKKRFARKMDFNDLITELLVALKNDPLLLRLLQERFLYLLVDEHQDTNDAQNFIVALIAEFFETPNLFIVGDEKQAIYRFQGASVENFLLFRNRYKKAGIKIISLDTNYRSHEHILGAAFSMIENNYEGDEHKELRIKLKAGAGTAKKPIEIVTGENTRAIEDHLVHALCAITEKEPEATVAIITRRNRDLERVLRLLESNNIPVSSERSIDIFRHPAGSLFFDLLEYFSDPTNMHALARTLIGGMWGLSFETSVEMIRALRAGHTDDIAKKIPELMHVRNRMHTDGAIAFIVHAAEASGFEHLASRDPAAVHVWRGIIALAESLSREGAIEAPGELITALLAYRLSAESKAVKVSVGAPDLPIKAMTAHGSKGLEFDYVFMPYATEESWITRPRGASFVLPEKQAVSHDIRDTRRLFYVALTRARKHVTILSALEESDGKVLAPLRFISELDKGSIKELSLPRRDAVLSKRSGESHADDKMIDLAKQVLLTSGLSVTALNHFLKCPSEFLYESILKLPQAPAVAAEKGTAMHEAIAAVWKEKTKTVDTITNILIIKITEYIDASFLSIAEKEAVKKELIENAPVVAQALAGHFQTEGKILTEHFVRTVFKGKYNNTPIEIPIHGKLDAIIEMDSTVSVFDYKTRQAMSEAEIRGDTKNSSGDYFRQLVFYTLLLSGDHRFALKRIEQALVFVSPDKKGRCPIITLPVMPEDTEKLKQDIQSVIDSVWSGNIASARCDDPLCEWCRLRS